MREKMKTVSILLMSCLIGCFAITGCSSTASSSVTTKTLQTSGVQKTTSNSATSAATSKTTTAESKASTTGKPTFKFGFIHTSFSDQIGTMYQKYAQYASNQLGCEITFSEVGSDSDKRMNALQNMIQVGCNGIIVSSVTEPMLKACEQSKVYLIMVGNSLPKALKDVASKNPYFIGAVEVNNYQAGYNMLSVMYDKGCRNVALLTWTPGVVETFDSRSEGMHDFLGKHSDMKVATEFSGTGAKALAEGAEQILASYKNIDGIATVMANSAIPSSIYSYGLSGKVKYAGIDINEGTDELLQDGTMCYAAGGAFPNAEICVAVLYNYLTDYKLWKDNTKPLQRPLVELKSVDDYKDYMKYLEGDIPVYTGDELKTIISVYKTNVTWDDINALTQDSSLESVKKRHAGLFK